MNETYLYLIWGIGVVLVIIVAALIKAFRKRATKYILYVDKEGITCPYCHSEFNIGEGAIKCSECNTPHHIECWRLAGGCGVFGCWARPKKII